MMWRTNDANRAEALEYHSQHIVQLSHSRASSKAEGTPQSATNADSMCILSSTRGILGISVILLLWSWNN